MKTLELDKGLKLSFKILALLRKDKKLKNILIYVECFTNCRERGLTYVVASKKNKWFTFCTYEHRNSDNIIINGKEGWISHNGELPYSGNKWECLGRAGFEDYESAAKNLSKLIREWHYKNKLSVCEQ